MTSRHQDSSRRKRRNRRWSVNINVLLKRIAIAALLILGTILAVKLFEGDNEGTAQVLQTGFVQISPPLTPSPIAILNNTSMPSIGLSGSPKVTGKFQRKKAKGYLILVNWENKITSNGRPAGLDLMGDIFDEDTVIENKDGSINKVAGEAANEMFKAAKKQGIGRYLITSAYRSVSYQNTLFQARVTQDPDYANDPYANPVKVLPGDCSEHATGLAIDVLSENYKDANEGYADTQEGKWLAENAHKYGFILRYPKDKEHITGVIYESWHYRYIGVEAATEMFESELCLEEYVE